MALSASSNKKITVVIDIEYGINSITYYTLTMLPKIIHYCWFGRNPLPELAIKCNESWRKFLPEYEIRAWNEDNFNVNIIPYTAEAYREKKYAFVSDFVRFWILYRYGGLYFDTDVEIIRSMDNIIEKGPFMGCENDAGNGEKALGVAPGLGLYNEILEYYRKLSFYNNDGTLNQVTIVKHTTTILIQHGLKDVRDVQFISGIYIYPKEYFCPKDYVTGKLNVTNKTVAIHHYGASWIPFWQRMELKFWQMLGLRPHRFIWHLNKLFQEKYSYAK